MTMSRFIQQPRIGHLERLKKIVGYLANFPHGVLRFRLHEPDYSNLPHKEYDWQRTVYGGAKEEIPHGIPEPKGKHVTTTTCVDANLHHDQVTGKAVTACLHIVNATPSHWYTKRQATVETATYGSEFVATRIATDQILDLRYTLMYLGVPVRSKSYMFGDNKSVVDSASIPSSTLSKKSTLASYHRVREAIAAGYLQFNWKDGKSNPADILSKHWEFANIWPLLKPLLFWKGDTDELNAKTKGSDRIPTKKEPCLTPTLMDEGQARNPNTTYNGYKMEFWKFALTQKLICPVQHNITEKEQKETTKKGGISLTIMCQRQTYNSIHKPQRSPNEMIGFNQDDHPYKMCNETGIPEFLELQIPGIPMVVMVTSRACSLRDPTQQGFINARTLPIYKCHTCFKF